MNNLKHEPMLILFNVNSLSHLAPFNAQGNIIRLSREKVIPKWDQWLRKDEWYSGGSPGNSVILDIQLKLDTFSFWAAESTWQLGYRVDATTTSSFSQLTWGSHSVNAASRELSSQN